MASETLNDIDSFAVYLNSTDEKQLVGDILAKKVISLSPTETAGIHRIFDMGCGSGEISSQIIRALDSQHISYEYDAIDPAKERIAKFREKVAPEDMQHVRFLEESFSDDYFPTQPYDIFIACQSLYYFADLRKIMEKILGMAQEIIIVHHGATGLEAFEKKYGEYFKKTIYGASTYLDVKAVLDSINVDNRYIIDFKKIYCSVDVSSCKDPKSVHGKALLSFFLGNDIKSLPMAIQEEMSAFIKKNYLDLVQREQGIFFIRQR